MDFLAEQSFEASEVAVERMLSVELDAVAAGVVAGVEQLPAVEPERREPLDMERILKGQKELRQS